MTKQTYKPDKELIQFAKEFSDNFKLLTFGTYRSENGKYRIDYKEYLKDYKGIVSKAGSRVTSRSGVIELDKSIFMNDAYTSDFIFYIIIFSVVLHINKGDCILSDEMAINYYLKTKRSIKNLISGYSELLKYSPTDLNIKRIKLITKITSK